MKYYEGQCYCKHQTLISKKAFPFNYCPRAQAINRKKQGSVTYSTDRENEVSKIFIGQRLIGHAEKKNFQS